MNLLNCSNARHYFLSYLKSNGISWGNVLDINLGRYYLISNVNGVNVGMMFKDDWYKSFGVEAKKKGWLDEDGEEELDNGDSINVKELKYYISKGVTTIYTVYKTGDIYSIDVQKLLRNSHNRINKEGVEVRSFSIHKYTLERNVRG